MREKVCCLCKRSSVDVNTQVSNQTSIHDWLTMVNSNRSLSPSLSLRWLFVCPCLVSCSHVCSVFQCIYIYYIIVYINIYIYKICFSRFDLFVRRGECISLFFKHAYVRIYVYLVYTRASNTLKYCE
jgi:hypothetical protein